MDKKGEIVKEIFVKTGALKQGHFLLTSGLHSNVYFEKIKLIINPENAYRIAQLFLENFLEIINKADYIVSPAFGAIVFGAFTGLLAKKKFVFTQRESGKMKLRSGFYEITNSKAIIVEDIITTGGSVREVIDLLKKYNVNVVAILSILDRSNNNLDFYGIKHYSLLKWKTELYNKENCPLCKKGIPLEKPGRSSKVI